MKLVLRNQNKIILSTRGIQKNKIIFEFAFKSISSFGKKFSTRKTHISVFHTTFFTQLSMAGT